MARGIDWHKHRVRAQMRNGSPCSPKSRLKVKNPAAKRKAPRPKVDPWKVDAPRPAWMADKSLLPKRPPPGRQGRE